MNANEARALSKSKIPNVESEEYQQVQQSIKNAAEAGHREILINICLEDATVNKLRIEDGYFIYYASNYKEGFRCKISW